MVLLAPIKSYLGEPPSNIVDNQTLRLERERIRKIFMTQLLLWVRTSDALVGSTDYLRDQSSIDVN